MVVEKRRQGRDGGRTSEAPAALAKGALVSTAARTTIAKIFMRMLISATLLYGLLFSLVPFRLRFHSSWLSDSCLSELAPPPPTLITQGFILRLLLTSVLFVACAEKKISHTYCDLLPRDSESGTKLPVISTEIRYQFLVLIKKVHFLV